MPTPRAGRGETDWTLAALVEHIDALFRESDRRYLALFQAQKEATAAALDAANRATTKAETAMERRLEGMNEFRDALKDQSAKFITREEMGLIVDPVRSDIAVLRAEMAQSRGRDVGLNAAWLWLVGAVAAVAAVVSAFAAFAG